MGIQIGDNKQKLIGMGHKLCPFLFDENKVLL
jgi:hypothetical protein